MPWGAVQAILDGLFVRLARSLARRFPRFTVDAGRAGLWALAASPYVAWVAHQLFLGPRVQKLPGRQAIEILLFVVGVLAIWQALRVLWTLHQAVRGRLRFALSAAGLSLLLTLALNGADRAVLPRLYPFFHLSLELCETALAILAVALCESGLGWRNRPSTPGRGAGCLIFVTLITVASFSSLMRIYRATVLRGLVIERTTLAAQIMRPYAAWRARRLRLPALQSEASPAKADFPLPPTYAGPRLAGRDVFLITIDALRQDRLTPERMPEMSALAGRGVTFARAYTQVPHTSFAVATLLTGKPVYALLELGEDAASHETLPLVLRRFRYKTAAFYPPAVFFIERERLKRLEESAYGFEYVKYEYMAAPGRTDQVITFLETEKPAHAFVWVHYFEPHEPYDPHVLPDGHTTTPQSSDRERYDGEARFVDAAVKKLVDYIERTRPGALIVLAADHGEEFSEHGGRYHGTTLYEEQVHVPLFFTELSKTPLLRPRTLAQPVGLIDLAPTLLGLLDIEKSARMRGHDLSPWLLAGSTELPTYPIYAEIGRQKMVVVGDHKLICDLSTDTCQTFDLQKDPAERHNTIDSAPDEARRLREKLDSYLGESRRYEATSGTRGVAAEAAVLTRARLGDRAALAPLFTLLGREDVDPMERRQALELFAGLVATAPKKSDAEPLRAEPTLFAEATEALLRKLFAQAKDASDMPAERQKRWAAVAILRLFGQRLSADDAASQSVAALIGDTQADVRQRLAGALALAQLPSCAPPRRAGGIDCVGLWLSVLPATLQLEDPDAARPLLELVGRSRDKRAKRPLIDELSRVRTRADVVAALGALDDRSTVPELAKLLFEDPYVNVRVAAATAIAAIGGPTAHGTLEKALAGEREQTVRSAISGLLAAKSPKPPKSN